MDPNIIQEIMSFLSKWYIWELIIMIIAILLTLLAKIPIKKYAEKWQEKYQIDKSKITWINAIFPYVFVAIMVFILYWYKSGWDMNLKDPGFWKNIGSRTGILGSGAIGFYELIKKLKQAIVATHEANVKAKQEKANAEITEVAVHGDSVVVEEPVKATKKVVKKPKAEEVDSNPVQPVIKETRH